MYNMVVMCCDQFSLQDQYTPPPSNTDHSRSCDIILPLSAAVHLQKLHHWLVGHKLLKSIIPNCEGTAARLTHIIIWITIRESY